MEWIPPSTISLQIEIIVLNECLISIVKWKLMYTTNTKSVIISTCMQSVKCHFYSKVKYLSWNSKQASPSSINGSLSQVLQGNVHMISWFRVGPIQNSDEFGSIFGCLMLNLRQCPQDWISFHSAGVFCGNKVYEW